MSLKDDPEWVKFKTGYNVDRTMWQILYALLVILLCTGFLCDDIHAQEIHGDSIKIKLINCREVPDSCVKRGYDISALWGYDEWGEPYEILPAKLLECPCGTRKMTDHQIQLSSNPPMSHASCWTVKIICDTIWTEVVK